MIREIAENDAGDVCAIIRASLGYACEPRVVRERIASLAGDGHCISLVDEEEGEVRGFIHALRYDTLHRFGGWDVVSLAVAPAWQSSGVGSALLSALEREVARRGGSYVRLNSRMEREEAHRFYERRGYACDKVQKRFIKELS